MDPWGIGEKIASLTKFFNLIEERQKKQDDKITRLRQDNAELRRENAHVVERLARLEEGRATVAAEVKAALEKTLGEWENQRLREELADAKRKQLPEAKG